MPGRRFGTPAAAAAPPEALELDARSVLAADRPASTPVPLVNASSSPRCAPPGACWLRVRATACGSGRSRVEILFEHALQPTACAVGPRVSRSAAPDQDQHRARGLVAVAHPGYPSVEDHTIIAHAARGA